MSSPDLQEPREPMALEESGHGNLLTDAWRVKKMLDALHIKSGEVTPRWIEAKILLVLSAHEGLGLADLLSEIRGTDHLEGLSDTEITHILDHLIADGKVTVTNENGTYYFFVKSALSDDEIKHIMFVLESNITLSDSVGEEE